MSLKVKSMEFCKKLLMEEKILVSPGIAFGSSGEYHVRIPLIKPIEVLEKVAFSVEKIVKEYNK